MKQSSMVRRWRSFNARLESVNLTLTTVGSTEGTQVHSPSVKLWSNTALLLVWCCRWDRALSLALSP